MAEFLCCLTNKLLLIIKVLFLVVQQIGGGSGAGRGASLSNFAFADEVWAEVVGGLLVVQVIALLSIIYPVTPLPVATAANDVTTGLGGIGATSLVMYGANQDNSMHYRCQWRKWWRTIRANGQQGFGKCGSC